MGTSSYPNDEFLFGPLDTQIVFRDGLLIQEAPKPLLDKILKVPGATLWEN